MSNLDLDIFYLSFHQIWDASSVWGFVYLPIICEKDLNHSSPRQILWPKINNVHFLTGGLNQREMVEETSSCAVFLKTLFVSHQIF